MKTFFEEMSEAIDGVTANWLEKEPTPEDWHGVCSMFMMQAATSAIGTVDRKSFLRAARMAYSDAEKAVRERTRLHNKEIRALGRGLLDSILGGPIDPDLEDK